MPDTVSAKMDVVILAGGPTPEALAAALGESVPRERALIEIQGRATIAYLLDSLREVPELGRVAVVGNGSTLATTRQIAPHTIGVAAKSTLVENVIAGAAALDSDGILLCTCDIPLVTSATWHEFLRRVEQNRFEAAYPIVRRETVQQQFAEGKRTYATLTDGTFTGGNAFVLPRANLENLRTVIDAAYNARKNPLAIARILGVGFVLKAVLKRLSIADLERKMSRVLGCRAGAVEMQDASIAFDVDKPEDFAIAQRLLAPIPRGATAETVE